MVELRIEVSVAKFVNAGEVIDTLEVKVLIKLVDFSLSAVTL